MKKDTTMKSINWDWVAGFFEGEGNISWYQGVKGTKQGTSGRIVIGQKDERSLIAIKDFLEGNGFTRCLLYRRPAYPPRNPNPIWILAINQRDEVVRFLEQIKPMLFEKQAKAADVLKRLKKLMQERDEVLNKALELKQSGKTWEDIRRLAHINYRTLNNYARSKGIELRLPSFDAEKWRNDRIKRGLCTSCGKLRGTNGTRRMCRQCQDKSNIRSKEWKRRKRQELKT